MELGDFSSNDSTPGNHVAPYPTLKPLLDCERHAPIGAVKVRSADIAQSDAVAATAGGSALRLVQAGRNCIAAATVPMMIAIVRITLMGLRSCCGRNQGDCASRDRYASVGVIVAMSVLAGVIGTMMMTVTIIVMRIRNWRG